MITVLLLGCQSGLIPRSSMEWTSNERYLGPVRVSWVQEVPGEARVEFFANGVWQSSPSQMVDEGEASMTLLGVPLGSKTPWRVVVDTEMLGTVVQEARNPILARPLPSSFPELTIDVTDQLEREDYLLTSVNERNCGWCSGPYWTIIIDRRGEILWATRTTVAEWTLFAQLSVSGDHLIYDVIRRLDVSEAVRTYLDEPIESIGMPGHHHGFVELPDGTLAWARNETNSVTETIAEKAPGSDVIRTVWDCGTWAATSSCRSNALEYDPSRDTYWFSSYSLSSAAEIDRTTGDLVGYSDLTGSNGAQEYTFSPPESIFTWQHGIRVLSGGNLLISTDDPQRRTTRVSEYTLDRDAGLLTEVWNFNPGIRAEYNGDVLRLPANGNTMHAMGSAGIIYEVDNDGGVVWQLSFPDDHLVGRVTLLDDPYALLAP